MLLFCLFFIVNSTILWFTGVNPKGIARCRFEYFLSRETFSLCCLKFTLLPTANVFALNKVQCSILLIRPPFFFFFSLPRRPSAPAGCGWRTGAAHFDAGFRVKFEIRLCFPARERPSPSGARPFWRTKLKTHESKQISF